MSRFGGVPGPCAVMSLTALLMGCHPQQPTAADLAGAVTAYKLDPAEGLANSTAEPAIDTGTNRLHGWKVEQSVAVSNADIIAEIRAALTDPISHSGTDAMRSFEPTLGLVFADGNRQVTVLVSLSCRRAYIYGTDPTYPERAVIRTILSIAGVDRLRDICRRLFQP